MGFFANYVPPLQFNVEAEGRTKTMQKRNVGAIASRSIAIAVMFVTAWQATAQDAKATYPSMAPLDQ